MTSLRRNFHVPLPENLYVALKEESARCGRPATELAREALEAWMKERERAAMFDAISEYAATSVGDAGIDLDEALEEAASEELGALDEEGP